MLASPAMTFRHPDFQTIDAEDSIQQLCLHLHRYALSLHLRSHAYHNLHVRTCKCTRFNEALVQTCISMSRIPHTHTQEHIYWITQPDLFYTSIIKNYFIFNFNVVFLFFPVKVFLASVSLFPTLIIFPLLPLLSSFPL